MHECSRFPKPCVSLILFVLMGTWVAGAGRGSCPLMWSPVTVLAGVIGVWLLPGTGVSRQTPLVASLSGVEARENPREFNNVDLGLASGA